MVEQVVCIEEEGYLLVQGIVCPEAPVYDGTLIGSSEGDALQVGVCMELGDDTHAGVDVGTELWCAGKECAVAL